MTIVLTARQAADSPQFIPVLNNVRVRLPVGRPRTRPTAVAGDTGALLRRAYRCHVGAQWMETLIALCDTPLARNAGDSAHPSIAPDNSGDKELADAVLAEIPGPSSCRMRSGATWPYTPGTAPPDLVFRLLLREIGPARHRMRDSSRGARHLLPADLGSSRCRAKSEYDPLSRVWAAERAGGQDGRPSSWCAVRREHRATHRAKTNPRVGRGRNVVQ